MLIRRATDIPSSEITPKADYLNRRTFLTGMAAAGVAALGADRIGHWANAGSALAAEKLQTVKSPLSVKGETPTSYQDITHYNNFYEFGTDKGDPARNAGAMHTRPWTVQVTGLVKQKKTVDIDTLLKLKPMEERVYRYRCVEGMEHGDSVGRLFAIGVHQAVRSAAAARSMCSSCRSPTRSRCRRSISRAFSLPYSEGLRMDEAMHPLTLLTFGLYGEALPNQDGAPVRVIVPWKYGFKSAKSIVKINFTDKEPPTTWNMMAPNEYGFYSNVNPNVDHPRWSQKTERRIGAPLFKQRQPTLMFNGYGDQVASLYNGMDLKKYF